jgi:hypothetical protein
MKDAEKGFSAGQVRRMTSGRREHRGPNVNAYDIRTPEGTMHGLTLKDIHKLLPNVKPETLRKRLSAGDRSIERLSRAPDPKKKTRGFYR